MDLKPEEISKIIKAQIKQYDQKLKQDETGTIILVGDGIARASGLESCMANELVEFENGEYGMALNLEEDSVSIVILGSDVGLHEGSIVRRTGRSAVLEALKLTASFIRNPSETYGLRGVSSLLWASVRCVGRNGLVRCVGRIWQTLQMKHPHLPHSRPTRYRTFRMGRLRIDVCADSLRRPLRVNPSKSASSR